jgi:hypothetical protein
MPVGLARRGPGLLSDPHPHHQPLVTISISDCLPYEHSAVVALFAGSVANRLGLTITLFSLL